MEAGGRDRTRAGQTRPEGAQVLAGLGAALAAGCTVLLT